MSDNRRISRNRRRRGATKGQNSVYFVRCCRPFNQRAGCITAIEFAPLRSQCAGAEKSSGCASDVSRQSATRATAQCDLATWWRWKVVRCAFDLSRAGRTAERRTGTIARYQVKCLRRIERRRSRLSHMYYLATAIPEGQAPVRPRLLTL